MPALIGLCFSECHDAEFAVVYEVTLTVILPNSRVLVLTNAMKPSKQQSYQTNSGRRTKQKPPETDHAW